MFPKFQTVNYYFHIYFIFRAFELALRTYEGDDPFEPWFNYIVWIEQTFPKTGKDGNLNALLEKCIQQFKGNGQYNQDVRFFEVWMKYVSFKILLILSLLLL